MSSELKQPTKTQLPGSTGRGGDVPSTPPCCGASPLLLHSSLGARWSTDLQDKGLLWESRSGRLVMWGFACQAGNVGGLWPSCGPMHWQNPYNDPQSCPYHTAQCQHSWNPRSPNQFGKILEVYPTAGNGLRQHLNGSGGVLMPDTAESGVKISGWQGILLVPWDGCRASFITQDSSLLEGLMGRKAGLLAASPVGVAC